MLLAGGAVVAQSLADVLAQFVAEQESQVVLLVERDVIVGGVLPGEDGKGVPRVRHIGGRGSLVASCRLVVVVLAYATVAAVDGQLCLQGEALDWGNLQIGAAHEAGALNVHLVVIALVHQGVHMRRVPHVGCLVDAAVLLVSLCEAGHLAGSVEHRGVAGVMAQRAAHLEVLVDDVVEVQAAVVAVHLVVLQQSLVIHSSQRQAEVGLVVAATDAGLVVLRGRVLQNGVVPVGEVAVIDEVYHLVLVVAGNGGGTKHVVKRYVRRAPVARCQVGLVVGTVNPAPHLSLAVHALDGRGGRLHGQIGREVDTRLARLATLGGDDDDTVGALRTVDGGRGGVLQNVHRFDRLPVYSTPSTIISGELEAVMERLPRRVMLTADPA